LNVKGALLVNGAAAAMQRETAATVNIARVIAAPYIILCDCCVESKKGTISRNPSCDTFFAVLLA
jgi:hypothetical protein